MMDKGLAQRLEQIVNRRIVCVMSHGKSIKELEEKIEMFRDKDVCWVSFNYYSIMQDFILSKIGQKLDIILDCAAGRVKSYETEIRIPRLKKYISQNATILTTWRLMKTQYEEMGLHDFYLENKDRLIIVDHILGILNVPNTLSLLLCSVAVGRPKKIILFGVDGYKGNNAVSQFETYYKPKLQRKRNETILGKIECTLKSTTLDFERDFIDVYNRYCRQTIPKPYPKIINCSPNSLFNIFRNINYDELKEEL